MLLDATTHHFRHPVPNIDVVLQQRQTQAAIPTRKETDGTARDVERDEPTRKIVCQNRVLGPSVVHTG